MFSKKKNVSDEQLDRAGQILIRSAGASNEDIEMAASDSMLFARIRGQIASEQRLRDEAADPWMSFLVIARRAVPVMAIVALIIILASAFTTSSGSIRLPGEANVQAAAVCTLADKDECAVSTNEVMATIFFSTGQGAKR
jgi:hypothetical protein